jgi:hypothetical protein
LVIRCFTWFSFVRLHSPSLSLIGSTWLCLDLLCSRWFCLVLDSSTWFYSVFLGSPCFNLVLHDLH